MAPSSLHQVGRTLRKPRRAALRAHYIAVHPRRPRSGSDGRRRVRLASGDGHVGRVRPRGRAAGSGEPRSEALPGEGADDPDDERV